MIQQKFECEKSFSRGFVCIDDISDIFDGDGEAIHHSSCLSNEALDHLELACYFLFGNKVQTKSVNHLAFATDS